MKIFDSNHAIEKITTGVGSVPSLIAHTVLFFLTLLIGALHILSWDIVLLVLTTGVSLEAIYLAIFIQMSVNHQSKVIKDVEQDVDEIQKDIDSIEEDVDEIQEDDQQESEEKREYRETLATISSDLQKLLEDIEKLKKK